MKIEDTSTKCIIYSLAVSWWLLSSSEDELLWFMIDNHLSVHPFIHHHSLIWLILSHCSDFNQTSLESSLLGPLPYFLAGIVLTMYLYEILCKSSLQKTQAQFQNNFTEMFRVTHFWIPSSQVGSLKTWLHEDGTSFTLNYIKVTFKVFFPKRWVVEFKNFVNNIFLYDNNKLVTKIVKIWPLPLPEMVSPGAMFGMYSCIVWKTFTGIGQVLPAV